ncbi:MAG: sigma-54 dependent transcriptional regulator [Gemmataceae bacterium]
MPKLLVVDDEAVIRQSFEWVFGAKSGIEVISAGTVAEGWDCAQRDEPDVIVLDLQLPDGTGLELFDRLRAADPKRPVLFITAHGTTETAIEAMKRGAFDYLVKPLDLERLSALIDRAFEAARLMREPAMLPEDAPDDRLIGRCPAMQEVFKQIGRVAPQEVNVLISGESGTGKELVARAIYQHSRRAAKPFLAINCAAIPDGLVESELFGHERGAFTGADRQRVGKFEQVRDGTILLDEIGDMPLAVQAKMLRLLQDQRFERVGGNEPVATRVRVLAATNRDLEKLIAAGRFRNDLYYRLKEVTILLPPLRERHGDIPELAHHFLFQFARETERDLRGFDPAVLARFESNAWPGNIRELRGVVRQSALRATGPVIQADSLPAELSSSSAGAAPGRSGVESEIDAALKAGKKDLHALILGGVERELIVRVLRHTRGHQGQACEILGIDPKTLRAKLRDLNLAVDKIVIERPD